MILDLFIYIIQFYINQNTFLPGFIIRKKSSDNYLVMASEGIQSYPFQSMNRFDFQNTNTYEGCDIDTY